MGKNATCEHGRQRYRCKGCGKRRAIDDAASSSRAGKKRAAPQPSAAGPSQRPHGGSSVAGTSAAHAQAGALDTTQEERSDKRETGSRGTGKSKKRAPPIIPYGTGTALGYEVLWTDRPGYAYVLQ